MSKGESFNEVAAMELNFSGDNLLESAIVGGSFYYIREFGLAVFLVNEDTGFALCVGQGNFHTGQTIQSFKRLQLYGSREQADEALQDFEKLTLDYFTNLSTVLDETARESTSQRDSKA